MTGHATISCALSSWFKQSEAHYDPILGLHNCPAEIELLGMGEAEAANGNFVTRGFIPRDRRLRVVERKATVPRRFRAAAYLPKRCDVESAGSLR